MFAKLHGKKQRPISSINSQTPRTSNTTHANSISLSSGNLIVGSNRNLRQKKEQFGSQQRASGRNLISNKENDDNVNNGGDNNYDNGERVHRHHIPGLKIKAYQAELGYHESRFSENLVMLNLVEFPDIKPGDLVELKTYHKIHLHRTEIRKFILLQKILTERLKEGQKHLMFQYFRVNCKLC